MDEVGRLDTQTHLLKFSFAHPLPILVRPLPLPIDSLVLTWELLYMTTNDASVALAKSRPISTTSYLVSLLVVINWRRTAHFIESPSGDCKTIPIPPVHLLDKSSV